MTTDAGTQADRMDALVIFGATGDLAKLETFPALVGLVDRGVLDVPVIGVAKSGWGLDQFRNYAVNSLKLNKMDPASPAATKMLGLLRYVDGDRTIQRLIRLCRMPSARAAMSCSTWRCATAIRTHRSRHIGGRPARSCPRDGREAIW